jgi:hypothetical protein
LQSQATRVTAETAAFDHHLKNRLAVTHMATASRQLVQSASVRFPIRRSGKYCG